MPNTKNHNLNRWVVSKSALVCFSIRRSEISPKLAWNLSWPYWGTLPPSQGEATHCWRVSLFLCLTLPQAVGRSIPKEGKEKESSSLFSQSRAEDGTCFPGPFSPSAVVWHGGRSLDVRSCIPPWHRALPSICCGSPAPV